MLETPTLAKALTSAEASESVRTVMYQVPTADEVKVGATIADEVGRIEHKLSLMLAHIEGHYESQVAKLKAKLIITRMYWPAVGAMTILGALIGIVVGKMF